MNYDKLNYVIVGGFVLAMLAGLIVALAMLTGRTGATDAYYVVYRNVTGIKFGTQVEEVVPEPSAGGMRFRVDFSVKEGWQIPEEQHRRDRRARPARRLPAQHGHRQHRRHRGSPRSGRLFGDRKTQAPGTGRRRGAAGRHRDRTGPSGQPAVPSPAPFDLPRRSGAGGRLGVGGDRCVQCRVHRRVRPVRLRNC